MDTPEQKISKFTHSRKNVLRGLHGDNETWKHITCVYGAFYLVVVDYREDSPRYLQWDSFTLDDKNCKSVLVPPGFLMDIYVYQTSVYFIIHNLIQTSM